MRTSLLRALWGSLPRLRRWHAKLVQPLYAFDWFVKQEAKMWIRARLKGSERADMKVPYGNL